VGDPGQRTEYGILQYTLGNTVNCTGCVVKPCAWRRSEIPPLKFEISVSKFGLGWRRSKCDAESYRDEANPVEAEETSYFRCMEVEGATKLDSGQRNG